MSWSSVVPRVAFVSLVAIGPILAQQHEHGSPADEKLGRVSFKTSCSRRRPAVVQPCRGAAALLRVRARDRRVHRDARGRSVVRDGGVGHCAQPVGQSVRGRYPSGRAAAAGPRRCDSREDDRGEDRRARARTSRRCRSCTPVSRRSISVRGCWPIATRWPRSPAPTRTTPRPRSSTRWRSRRPRRPTDKTYADQLKAGAILEKLVVSQPDHPGLAHYIIHSYDVPPLADRALEAARRYATIAPSAPHALHMPSHTFTRLGYWQESIDTNIASGAAAKRDGATAEELHSMDYRTYAYLQTAQDGAARGILDALPGGRKPLRPGRDWFGRARLRRRLRARRDPRALRARARRLGGRRGARRLSRAGTRTRMR